MRITIDTVPHEEQRYNTAGDWYYNENGDLFITVSDMQNRDYEFCVGIHEAIEAWFCREHGIKEEEVSTFDKRFKGDGECGDDPEAPYREEHFFATSIERFISQALRIDWKKYDEAVNNL